MTKDLRRAIMLRSNLRNKLNKNKTLESNLAYKKQRNLCTSLLRKAKTKYYANLNPSLVTDNKTFWKTVKPLLSEKTTISDSINLVENLDICSDDEKVAHIFNTYFSNVVNNLNIERKEDILNLNVNDYDPILKAIDKYKNHPSILKINETVEQHVSFSLQLTERNSIIQEILSLDGSKASPMDAIPAKIIKENCDIFSYKLLNDFNLSVTSGIYPNNLKLADITPAFKEGDRFNKENYRPVSILSALSKIFERLLYYQINNYMNPKLSIYQCGFRKVFSVQNCLLVMVEKWKRCLDNKGSTGVVMTDLSKAFDCLIHDLLIAKLNAYGFDYNSLKLVNSYLSNRCQRVRVNCSYSFWNEIIYGVPQGSILGPLLFNIYLSDLFIFCKDSDITNYADDKSPFSCNEDTEAVLHQLENDSKTLLTWTSNNGLQANPDKFHLILNNPDEKYFIQIQNFQIFNSRCEKLLGIKIDNSLSFTEHVTDLCSKASQKLHALSRLAGFMNTKQRRIIMKAFINSQFGYCPLVWMFHSRKLNNRINKIHDRSLRLIYEDRVSSFEELLIKDNCFTIHERNIQTLAIELYKVVNRISPELMSKVFPLKETVKYCSKNIFATRNVHTVKYGTESLAHLGPKVWAIIPSELKNDTNSLNEFKNKIKKWKPDKCPCNLCKVYIAGVGYIE